MSSIASLYNVPSTQSELMVWSFAHAVHHQDISRRIMELGNIQLPQFVLDPFVPSDSGVWTYQHQLLHEDQNLVLGIAGYDLLDIDWEDPNQLAGWIFLNATEHMKASDILGIG